jgi:hypothetical protein
MQCLFQGGLNKYAIIGDNNTIGYFKTLQFVMGNNICVLINTFIEKANLTYSWFKDRDALWDIIGKDKERQPKWCFALQIDEFNTVDDSYDIQLMFLRKNIPDTLLKPYNFKLKTPDFSSWKKYEGTGYLSLYMFISDAIIRAKQGLFSFSTLDVAYMPMKTPEYESINPIATEQLSQQFPFFVMFTFLIPLYYLVSKLAEEKENKSREGMKMMGLKDTSYFLSWFVFYLIINLVQAALITAMVCINLFVNSSKTLIFLHSFMYGVSLFGFAVIVVAILPTVRASATAATLIHLITYFFMFSLKNPDVNPRAKQVMSVFPNVAMSLGIYNLYDYEANQGGLDFGNVQQPLNGVTFLFAMLMLLFDSVLLTSLGLYLDQILQSQFGVAKKWNFVCSRQFCCGKKKAKSVADEADEYRKECLLNGCSDDEDQVAKAFPDDFEPVPEAVKRQEQTKECLKIRGLRRVFGPKVAVDNSNVTMYNGQIFALLGHNGAGKTTTISMLTGLIQATAGSASVFDLSVFDDMDEFRKILGVCPQHDVLFEQLTPKEHLELFAAFKGTPQNQVD